MSPVFSSFSSEKLTVMSVFNEMPCGLSLDEAGQMGVSLMALSVCE